MKIVKNITYSELTMQDFRAIIKEHKGCRMYIEYSCYWANGGGNAGCGNKTVTKDLIEAILAETIPGEVGYTYEDHPLQVIIKSVIVTL